MTTPTTPNTATVAAPKITDLTRTGQPDPTTNPATEPTIGRVVDALEAAWAAIRTHQPEIPAAVIVIASGSPTRPNQPMKWGHFATGRWQAGTNQHPEVLVSGEGLNRPADQVFTTLLHEAVHGLADVRGVKDTSRQGRWHNKKFADLAAELGMTTTKDDKLGFSPCTLTELTAARYKTAIAAISAALTLYRHPEVFETKERNSNNGLAVECECPRKLRVSVKTFDDGPIWCPTCGEYFLPEDIPRDDYNADHPLQLSTQDSQSDDATDNATDDRDDNEGDDNVVFYDPTGARYGIPTYPYRFAPTGLATTRQLRAQGLRPAVKEPVAQILWRKGKRVAYLYRVDQAKPKRTPTAAQLAALDRAMCARRTCPTCREVKGYYIPRRTGECLTCAPIGGPHDMHDAVGGSR